MFKSGWNLKQEKVERCDEIFLFIKYWIDSLNRFQLKTSLPFGSKH